MNCLHQALGLLDNYQGKTVKTRNSVHIRLVFHAFLGCLMTRREFCQQQEKQEFPRWLYWALQKALVFPQSPIEMELPVLPTPKHFSVVHLSSRRTISRQLHSFIETALSIFCHCWKRWSVSKSQDSLSGIWKAAALRGDVSSVLPSSFLSLKIPLKEVICY